MSRKLHQFLLLYNLHGARAPARPSNALRVLCAYATAKITLKPREICEKQHLFTQTT